ncbi:PA0069 family radical SAM protein [Roseateles sp. BYS180W]|uniref:PA0069 family radical SAM protein n=1 Tax=Roseateles rivi TaxID=3299028 RepID=A0ABW7FVQ4_9BURK
MSSEAPAPQPQPPLIKGRGSHRRLAHRFEATQRDAFDDGWGGMQAQQLQHEEAPAPRTIVIHEPARSILCSNQSPDIGFERSINPYRGCEHGCSYCFARPTHSYLNLSPGLDFETHIVAKTNAAELLREALARPGFAPRPLCLGVATDAYQPIERELRITRGLLEVLAEARHPVSLITKSALVMRDLDVLGSMAAQRQAAVYVSLTTLDAGLARRLEPRAAAPHRRLQTIAALAQAGVPVGVSVSPVIPFLNEPELERILQAAAEAGATRAFSIPLRLPWEVAPLFRQWLAQHEPLKAERIMARVQDMRGGRDNDPSFGSRMRGQGLWAELLTQRFRKACQRLGLQRVTHELDYSAFRPPAPVSGQGSLF